MSWVEYFRVRKLLGWTAAAIAAGIISYYFAPLQSWSGLIFTAILGWGTYVSLTSDGKYLRYSKWVLLIGFVATGILNGLPIIAGNFFGQVGISKNNFINFLGQFTMDEQPLITIVILVLTFGFALFLANKDDGSE